MTVRAGASLFLALALIQSPLALSAADSRTMAVKTGRTDIQLEVPAGWAQAPKPRSLTLCDARETECEASGTLLALTRSHSGADSHHMRIDFSMHPDAVLQGSMRAFIDRQKACVWPYSTGSTSCMSDLLPMGNEYECVEHSSMDAMGVKIPLVEFRPRIGARPVFAAAYIQLRSNILQVTLRAEDEQVYKDGMTDFRRMVETLRAQQERPDRR